MMHRQHAIRLPTFNLTEQTKSSLRWVALGMLGFGVLIGARFLYARLKKPREEQQGEHNRRKNSEIRIQERLNTHKTEYSEYYFDKNLEIEFIESNMPENPSVQDIYLNSPLIAKDEFIKYTREMRKRRRLIRKVSEEQYINTILTYEKEVQELLIRSQLELLESLEMEPYQFKQMEDDYEQVEDLGALQQRALQVLRAKLVTDTQQKKLSNEKLKQIVEQQLSFVQNRMYDRLWTKMHKEMKADQNQILVVIRALLEDIIYEKFGYEAEDIARKIQQIRFDTSERDEAVKKMESEINGLNNQGAEGLEGFDEDNDDKFKIKESAQTLQRSDRDQQKD